LSGGVSRVRPEELFAVLALFLFDFLHHQHKTSWSRWCITDGKNEENEKEKIERRKEEENIIDLIGSKKTEGNKMALSNRRFYLSFRSPVAIVHPPRITRFSSVDSGLGPDRSSSEIRCHVSG
jgi:hypothetical protein